jgi:hypothetical protein
MRDPVITTSWTAVEVVCANAAPALSAIRPPIMVDEANRCFKLLIRNSSSCVGEKKQAVRVAIAPLSKLCRHEGLSVAIPSISGRTVREC